MSDKRSWRDWGLVIGLLTLLPFVWFDSVYRKCDERDEMNDNFNKRGYVNYMGVLSFLFLFGAIAATKTYEWYVESKERAKAEELRTNRDRETEKLLNYVAEGFAKNDKDIQMRWAKNEFTDPWGKSVFLAINNKIGGTLFLSKGEDGVEFTEDDIMSEIHFPPVKQINKKTVKDVVKNGKPSDDGESEKGWKFTIPEFKVRIFQGSEGSDN